MRLLMAAAAALCLGAIPASAQMQVQAPQGTILDSSNATLGNTSTQLVGSTSQRSALFVQLNTAGVSLALNPNGAAAVNTAGSITITGQGSYINFASLGAIPNTAVNGICSATCSVTVWSYPK